MIDVIPPAKRTALVKESEAWLEVERQVVLFRVVDDTTAAKAATLARQAREVMRAKDEERKTITTPLLEAKRAADAHWKPMIDTAERIKRHCEQEIARYDRETEAARARVLVASAEALARKEVPTEPIPEPVHVDKTSVRHHWEPEITDADAVPREYCSPDLGKVKAAIWYADTPHKEPQPIPGVKFTLKSVVVVR